MQRQEKDPLGQVCLHFCFLRMTWQKKRQLVMDVTDVEGSKRHPLSSPTQFPWLRQLWGLATVVVLRLHGGAGLQQQRDHLVAAIQRCQVQRRQASGRRPRGSPHGVKA